MFKKIIIIVAFTILLAGCDRINITPIATEIPTIRPQMNTATQSPSTVPSETSTATLEPTATEQPTATSTPTPAIYGPTNFPEDINPLTGLPVSDPENLDRRPVAVKINIVPRRSNRPPWGLSIADIVYDYYHNDGYSRFHAIFYGENAELAGPIRSGRMPDYDLVHMYQSMFVYGSADALINQRLLNSDFADRIVLERFSSGCPPTSTTPLCRFEPSGSDFLLADSADISAFLSSRGVDNEKPNLEGMYFNPEIQAGGVEGSQVYVRYSGDNYTLWDYDPDRGLYLRFQDNVFDTGQGEDYAPLTDRLNDEQITASTVVVILARHEFYQQPPAEIIEILLSGSGTAYAFRDGQMYELQWSRPTTNSVLTLVNDDGSVFPFKPGKTWFQIVGASSQPVEQETGAWRYQFVMP